MRPLRFLRAAHSSVAVVHAMSRVIEGRMVFDHHAKAKFRQLLAKQCAFSQVELVTFCLMGNHFHLLLRIDHDAPNPLETASDREFLDHLDLVYSPETVQRIGWQLQSFRAGGLDREADALRTKFLARMRDVPSFMRELKQRFTQWHNRREGRKGPLWEDRYKSVLVEDSETAVRTMAAYIDLNPVRAGLVPDPKDYRWSGYGEAVVGKESARAGLTRLVRAETGDDSGTATWNQVQAIYRCWLYDDGREVRDEHGRVIRRGIASEIVDRVLEREEGRLAFPVLATTRLRHFSQGLAIGSAQFVESVFAARREAFPARRIDGARKIRGVSWGRLHALRDLRGS